jgi:hypothetical protein
MELRGVILHCWQTNEALILCACSNISVADDNSREPVSLDVDPSNDLIFHSARANRNLGVEMSILNRERSATQQVLRRQND